MLKCLGCAVALTGFTMIGQNSFATSYPQKPIKIVAPFAPGGAVDGIARVVAEHLSDHLGQPVVVENAAGAGGVIGAGRVAKSEADGYTLLFNNMSQSSVNVFNDNVPYDPLTAFSSIGAVAYLPMVVFARQGYSEGGAEAHISKIKNNPSDTFVATSGIGSATYLCQAQLQKSMGISGLQEIAYKGSGQALIDLASGQVDITCDTMLGAGGFAQQGRITPVAVASESRLRQLPDVPTFREFGYQDMDVAVWVALFGPKNLPADVVTPLSDALQKIVQEEKFQERMQQINAEAMPVSEAAPEALDARMRREAARWSSLKLK